MLRPLHLAFLLISSICVFAADKMAPDGKFPVHSMERPRPEVVAPQYDGQPVPAPNGAVVLFDGKDLSRWTHGKAGENSGADEAKWKVENGYFEVVKGTGTMRTREPVKGDGLLHIEWATPAEVKGKSQGRGNSGVFLSGFPEIQVLDSFENDTYADGQAGALYGQYPPRVNASRKPGEWQSYDIQVERAKVENGQVTRKARLTVRHNNVLIHDKVELDGRGAESILSLQDHGNPVRFRNIWFQPAESKQ